MIMSPVYPQELLESIRQASDILEVVSQYIPLKKSGCNFKALCPFHSEKTPSFMVSPEKQIFHCFGCGAGGDVFSFLMRQEGLNFPEAVRLLAERANIALPSSDPRQSARKEALLKIHELAAGYFHWCLLKSKTGEKARAYLKERGIRPDTIASFKLGYAQPSWDDFFRHAAGKGYDHTILVEAGLALPRTRKEGYYDRFRDRIIVPVCDARGRVIAFGGRVLDDSQPKYINSPDTPLFHKGEVLFGLHLAKDAISKEEGAIIGEGYFDVIGAHQEGVKNMVCSQGTALTPIQAQILKRHTDQVIVAYDADQAGNEAALRGLDIFLEKNFEVRIILLPPGEDPDSYIRKKGIAFFRELVNKSIPLLDFKLEKLCETFDVDTDRGKLMVARRMLETISRIESAVLQDSYIKKLARKLNVSESSVREEYRGKEVKEEAAPRKEMVPREENAERELLKFIFQDDTLMEKISDEFDPADFSPPLRPIAEKMVECHRKGGLPFARVLPASLREEIHQSLISQWLLDASSRKVSLKEVIDLLINIKKRKLWASLRRLQEEIHRALEEGGDIDPLQRESAAIRRQIECLSNRLKEKFGI